MMWLGATPNLTADIASFQRWTHSFYYHIHLRVSNQQTKEGRWDDDTPQSHVSNCQHVSCKSSSQACLRASVYHQVHMAYGMKWGISNIAKASPASHPQNPHRHDNGGVGTPSSLKQLQPLLLFLSLLLLLLLLLLLVLLLLLAPISLCTWHGKICYSLQMYTVSLHLAVLQMPCIRNTAPVVTASSKSLSRQENTHPSSKLCKQLFLT